MPRMARLVVPGWPHHVTQRGVRSMDIFHSDSDRQYYLRFLAREAERHGVRFLAWCLMPNHSHLIAIPANEGALAAAVGEAHRRYSCMVNDRSGTKGYLFQGRFHSCVLDQLHLLAALRYVERNPVKAGLVERPWDYPWSSCRYHCGIVERDPLVAAPDELIGRGDWPGFVGVDGDDEDRIAEHTRTGRPAVRVNHLPQLEELTGRELKPKKPGRPPAEG